MDPQKMTLHAHVMALSFDRIQGPYMAYALPGEYGFYPLRLYPALYLGIASDCDIHTLLLVDNAPLSFATYDEATRFASYPGRAYQGRVTLYPVADALVYEETLDLPCLFGTVEEVAS